MRGGQTATGRRKPMEWITDPTLRMILANILGYGVLVVLVGLLCAVCLCFLPAEKWEMDAMVQTFGRK